MRLTTEIAFGTTVTPSMDARRSDPCCDEATGRGPRPAVPALLGEGLPGLRYELFVRICVPFLFVLIVRSFSFRNIVIVLLFVVLICSF